MSESATGITVERLDWDSDHFGFPVARVADSAGPEQIRAAAKAADEMGIRCLTALVSADRTATITAAEDAGFRCYDVRTELDRRVREVAELPNPADVRQAAEADLPSLEPIARTRFVDSRFSADPHFPDDLVGELYVEWLRRGLQDGDRFLIASEELDGFVVCHLDEEAGVGTIELIAVTARSEGVGLGNRLVRGAETAFARAGMRRARVVTQGSNLSAQRLYQHHGYRTSSVELWLHRWGLN